jgi:hypothetical protein
MQDPLEELQNDRVDEEFEMRIRNSLGVTSRSPFDGGKQEWDLAAGFHQKAGRLQVEWPRMAAIFDQLADAYQGDARREDASAERRRRGLDW